MQLKSLKNVQYYDKSAPLLLFRGDCTNHFVSEWFVKFTPTT